MTRLTPAQTDAAKAKVYESEDGWRYWIAGGVSPLYPTRAEAERASIEEWRANL